ncbi:hypothetical protein KAK07_02705 [Ideonella sp. 4Y16]|uniref:hypothetical protein n=1 Tax=Ideonella alba TaxID=2824118 RepID=UPI001B35C5FD|nr:hypothetical protein [Ideonella alba]MBQ0942240.1 hypothetical protein [Ideonella alba]
MTEHPLNPDDRAGLQRALDHARQWAAQHQWQLGAVEMALGASLLAWGVQSGAVEMGQQLVASVLSDGQQQGLFGAAAGAALGTLPGLVLQTVGVAAMGTAFSVPALVLMGGGALLMGLAGYGAGRLAADYLQATPSLAEAIGPGSLVVVGVALLLDGARRIASDAQVRAAVSRFADGVLHLGSVAAQQVLSSLQTLVDHLNEAMQDLARSPLAMGSIAAATAGGVVAGGALAAGSVTVLGSHTLGAAAVTLGLVTAPVWPVVAGGVAAATGTYAAWRWWRRKGQKAPGEASAGTPLMLPRMTALAITWEPPPAA